MSEREEKTSSLSRGLWREHVKTFHFCLFHLALSLLFHSCTYLFFAISLPPFWVIDGQSERITRLLTFEMKSNHSIWCRKKLNFSLIVSVGEDVKRARAATAAAHQHGPTHISDFSMYISRISHFIISDIFMLFSSLLGWVVVQFARLFYFPLKWEWYFWVEIVFILRYESGQQEQQRGRVEHYCESIENLHFHIFHSEERGKKTRKEKWKFSFVYLAEKSWKLFKFVSFFVEVVLLLE